MIRDDLSIYTEADLIRERIAATRIWEAREKGLLVPRLSGRVYQYIGSEVCAAMKQLLPEAPLRSKEERIAIHATERSGFSRVRRPAEETTK